MFLKQQNCKICSKPGITILNVKFDDLEISKFFISEYDKKTSNFLNKKIGSKNFILKKCLKCNFIWQTNIPKKKFLEEIYDQIIDSNESLKKSEKIDIFQKKYFETEIVFLQNFLKKKNLNILDFGAGWGTWLTNVKRICPNIFAMELSLKREKYLKKKKINVINYRRKSIYDDFFHIVRLEQVLEHLVDMNEIVKNLRKMLKKNGILIIGVPNGQKEIKSNVIKIRKGPIQPLEHLNCFNNKSLKLFFKKNGFEPISIIEIILTFFRSKRFDYNNIRFILTMIKNSLISTKINFVKK